MSAANYSHCELGPPMIVCCTKFSGLSLLYLFCNQLSAYKKTSLEKPIRVFVQFLKELESENSERRKSFIEAEGWCKYF